MKVSSSITGSSPDSLKTELAEKQEESLDNLKKQQQRSIQETQDRYEKTRDAFENQSYDHLRNLKRKADKEAQRMDQQGKLEHARLGLQIQDEQSRVSREGREKIQRETKRVATELALIESESKFNALELQKHRNQSLSELQKNTQNEIEKIHAQKTKETEQQREIARQQLLENKKNHETVMSNQLSKNLDEIKKAEEMARNQLKTINSRQSRDLSLRTASSEDPFYDQIHLDITSLNTEHTLQFHVKVPEHERSKVRAQILGDSLLAISSQREHQYEHTDNHGGKETTKSFQSLGRTIPLDSPIQPKSLMLIPTDTGVMIELVKTGSEHRDFELTRKMAMDAARDTTPKQTPLEMRSKKMVTKSQT